MESYKDSKEANQKLAELYEKKDDAQQTLQEINPDYVGWISINDTHINYPVVHTKNNEFYLKHNFYKEQDFAGAIFMDYRNSENIRENPHTVIYGHRMKDGSMFGELKKFLDPSFYPTHNIIKFHSLSEKSTWEIFAIFITDNTDLLSMDFSPEKYQNSLKKIAKKVIMYNDENIPKNSPILSLSTCSPDNREERIIIQATVK